MIINSSTSIKIEFKTTAADIAEFIADIPTSAKVSVSTIKGDRYDSDTHSLTFTWTEIR